MEFFNKSKNEKYIEKSKSFLADAKKIAWRIGKNTFFVVLFLILIDIIFGIFLFYKYIYIVEKNVNYENIEFKFNDNSYNEIIKQWQERDENSQNFLQENHPDPFN